MQMIDVDSLLEEKKTKSKLSFTAIQNVSVVTIKSKNYQ